MSKLKSKVLSAVSAIALAGGIGIASAGTASAATPPCGPTCIDLFSKDFGPTPTFVLDVYKQKQAVGQQLILFRSSSADPAEDFSLSEQGQVSDFYQAGMVSSALNLHYGCNWSLAEAKCTKGPGGVQFPDDFAFEAEYTPYGVGTGLCAGTSATAASGTQVTLQSCGVSSKTVWVADTVDDCLNNPLYANELPVINGSDLNFSHPFVLTYPASSYPTDSPRPVLTTQNLTGFSTSGNTISCNGGGSYQGVASGQLWSAVAGVLP